MIRAAAVALLCGLVLQGGEPGLEITHRARAIAPGEVVVIDVRSRTPLRQVHAHWLNRAIVFYPLPEGRWQGLAPIDLSARAGRHMLTVSAISTEGRSVTREHAIAISARVFPVRRISVAAKFAEPPADELTRIEQERRKVEAIFAAEPRERLWTEAFVVPVPGPSTSSFGRRSIVNGEPRGQHTGADFQAATGTPVAAPNRGRVVLAADMFFPGGTIIIDHGAGLYSYLAHLSEFKVAEGDSVERGQTIALSGATGRVTGPHLHWTLRFGASRVDPLSLIWVFQSSRGPVGPR